ncbi:MAG TPA: hypothetical protein ENL38_00415 [Candidatus Aminicenantes bacterium]|nr:hypothetical protein [Candidatus Aminicenantes bacterium]
MRKEYEDLIESYKEKLPRKILEEVKENLPPQITKEKIAKIMEEITASIPKLKFIPEKALA